MTHTLHLAVRQSAAGFTVGGSAEHGGRSKGVKDSDLNGTFTYRVVAKRKDVKAERLAKFTLPQEIKLAAPPIPPTPPDALKPPLPAEPPPKKG